MNDGVPYLAGWLMKKGQKRRSWERRWFVLAGSFFMYFESPFEHLTHKAKSNGLLFLKGFSLLSHTELGTNTGQY